MAVTRLWPVRERLRAVIDYAENPEKTEKSKSKYAYADYQSLRDVISYAADEEKTEREYFCEGINCDPFQARNEFITVKEQFGKTDGIQAYHGYLSFREQDITPELAQRIGMEFADRVWGEKYQVIVTTHLNTKHLHCHFVINSVSFVDGKRCRETSWFKFYRIADEICLNHGLHTIENPERNPDSRFLKKLDEAEMPTRYNLARKAIDAAIAHCSDIAGLKRELYRAGYAVDFNPSHKYWTITVKGSKKPIRLYRLGESYTRERIAERIRENAYKQRFLSCRNENRNTAAHGRLVNYPALSEWLKRENHKGLYGLYLYYCYKLGFFKSHADWKQRRQEAEVNYLFRNDLMRLNEITAQTNLLFREKIVSADDLTKYAEQLDGKIRSLTETRRKLRNTVRTVNISGDDLSNAKNQIAEISKELKSLRKEARLCDGIAVRSDSIRQRLEQSEREESEKQNTKNMNDERR